MLAAMSWVVATVASVCMVMSMSIVEESSEGCHWRFAALAPSLNFMPAFAMVFHEQRSVGPDSVRCDQSQSPYRAFALPDNKTGFPIVAHWRPFGQSPASPLIVAKLTLVRP